MTKYALCHSTLRKKKLICDQQSLSKSLLYAQNNKCIKLEIIDYTMHTRPFYDSYTYIET